MVHIDQKSVAKKKKENISEEPKKDDEKYIRIDKYREKRLIRLLFNTVKQ